MGWMSEDGEINDTAFADYVSTTRLASAMEDCPMASMCGSWAEEVAADPNQFFADMDCGMDEHHKMEEDDVALSRSDSKGK